MASMDTQPTPVMSFATLDEAESALDWIGVDFVEAEGGFVGHLEVEDRELLDAAIGDPESPEPVRELARALVQVLDVNGAAAAAWSVAFAI